jgi:hypothetical protein
MPAAIPPPISLIRKGVTMLQFKNIDPLDVRPGMSLLDIIEDTNSSLPAYGNTTVVASRSNLSDYLDYTFKGASPQWCIGIVNIKQKQATMQSLAFRMLINNMSVAEATLDFSVMNNIFLAQTRYLSPVLLQPNTKVTLGLWQAANGSKITNMDGSYEIRLFARS